MVGREEEDYPDEMEERLVNEEYKIWKKNTPFLYGNALGSPDHRCCLITTQTSTVCHCRSCHHTCPRMAQPDSTVATGKLGCTTKDAGVLDFVIFTRVHTWVEERCLVSSGEGRGSRQELLQAEDATGNPHQRRGAESLVTSRGALAN